MSFQPFVMERWQSTWEHRVRFNLSESGVHPMTPDELLAMAGAGPKDLLGTRLGYHQSNGTDQLRAQIAALYPGASPDHVVVSSGSAEANFATCWRLLDKGSRVVIVLPTYMQTHGLAQNFGAQVHGLKLREELGWQVDPSDIDQAIVPGTRLVVVTNPNNPTGAVMAPELMDHIARRASAVGAWLLADEVYQGAERLGKTTPSFWGKAEKLIVVNGLSKAYGLPGLRIGWAVTSPESAEELWSRKDYTTIGPTILSDAFARLALAPAVRPKIIERTRGIIHGNWPIVEEWLKSVEGEFTWRAPDAGAIVWTRYASKINSSAFAEEVRVRQDVLIVPGDQFGMDGYIRVGFGSPPTELREALERIALAFRGQAVG
jgi:aspartate/methionine/tyrosine aminotransferase